MTAVVIPSIGAPELEGCLAAVSALDPPPTATVVVMSGVDTPPPLPSGIELIHSARRLGFAAAVNRGLAAVLESHDQVAVLNDDALPEPHWLGALEDALASSDSVAAAQGSVSDAEGHAIDGRGIAFDECGLPVQVDRDLDVGAEDQGVEPLLAVSATAALFRSEALRQAVLNKGEVFDERFGSYHEDLDLGLRLNRLGWAARWIGGAPCRHRGSSSGVRMRWRHPWWVLANRWRALAANLEPGALLRAMPRLLRGELRAVRTLARSNSRAPLVAAAVWCTLPWLLLLGWRRTSPGPRLKEIPGVRP